MPLVSIGNYFELHHFTLIQKQISIALFHGRHYACCWGQKKKTKDGPGFQQAHYLREMYV